MSKRALVVSLIAVIAIAAFLMGRKGAKESAPPSVDSSPAASQSPPPSQQPAPPAPGAVASATPPSKSSAAPNKMTPPRSIAAQAVPVEPRADSLGSSLDSIGAGAWKVWSGVTVKPKTEIETSAAVVGGISSFGMVEDAGARPRLDQFDARYPVAVYDSRNRKAGLITGSFSLVLKEGASWDAIANAHALLLQTPFEHTRTYIATSSRSPFDLEALYIELKNDARIESVQTEILHRNFRKN